MAIRAAAVLTRARALSAKEQRQGVFVVDRRGDVPVFHDDLVYSYWSTAGFPSTVNGAGGFDPDSYDRLRTVVGGFPDTRSVAALRELGVRSVLVHPERAVGTPWEGADTKPTAGLALKRELVDGVVLFRLR